MKIKYIVMCYVRHRGRSEPELRKEVEFKYAPSCQQIEEVLSQIKLESWDYVIDYDSGAVLPDYSMPRKCIVESVYATVEKRYYREELK